MLLVSVPQFPDPMLVVNVSSLGCGVKPKQAAPIVVVVVDELVVVVNWVRVLVAVSVCPAVCVRVVPGVVVVVVVEQGVDGGWQRSVRLVWDCPAFARSLQLPACAPCFFVFTLTPAKFPHTELVPLALTLSFPIPPAQRLEAWIVRFLRSFGVQPASGWLTHSSSWNVHLFRAAVPQTVPWSATGPLVCSWSSVAHWPCAWLVRDTSATVAASTRTSRRRTPARRASMWSLLDGPGVIRSMIEASTCPGDAWPASGGGRALCFRPPVG